VAVSEGLTAEMFITIKILKKTPETRRTGQEMAHIVIPVIEVGPLQGS